MNNYHIRLQTAILQDDENKRATLVFLPAHSSERQAIGELVQLEAFLKAKSSDTSGQ